MRALLAFVISIGVTAEAPRFVSRRAFGGETLQRVGIGTRRATVFKVQAYVAALYARSRLRDAAAILSASQPKVFDVVLLRAVDRARIANAFIDGIRRSTTTPVDALEIEKFKAWVQDFSRGDRLVVEYTPDHGTTLSASQTSVYDFDGTLAPGNIPEHTLLPEELKISKEDFWREVKSKTKTHDADEILIYMLCLLERAKQRNVSITASLLKAHGARTPFFAGVDRWFDRINDHAGARNLQLDHYVISSGLEEMIRATSVAQHFKGVFACKYVYDDKGVASWPSVGINYTTKTQFLFRINKGIENNWDNDAINRWQPMNERPMPFQRIIYLGDGDTDIPSMKMVRLQHGFSVAVFDPAKWGRSDMQRRVYNLIAEDRANFVVPADYQDGSQLDITIKGILGRIARDHAGYRGGAA